MPSNVVRPRGNPGKRRLNDAEPRPAARAANVAVAQDPAGNLKPAKDKSTERIDGIVALVMAIGRAMLPSEQPHRSVYEDRGILTL